MEQSNFTDVQTLERTASYLHTLQPVQRPVLALARTEAATTKHSSAVLHSADSSHNSTAKAFDAILYYIDCAQSSSGQQTLMVNIMRDTYTYIHEYSSIEKGHLLLL